MGPDHVSAGGDAADDTGELHRSGLDGAGRRDDEGLIFRQRPGPGQHVVAHGQGSGGVSIGADEVRTAMRDLNIDEDKADPWVS